MTKPYPVVITGGMYERKKTRSKRKIAAASSQSKKQARISGSGDYVYRGATPFYDTGRKVGGMVSTGLNWLGVPTNKPMFKNVGGRLGHAIGGIFGSGDYTIGGGESILTNGKELPVFGSGPYQNVVCHREYLKDITTGASNTFSLESFTLNPGLAATFPWLSTIAQNYEQYRVLGCVFEFKSTSADALNSTNTALGQVIMATEYNPAAPAYTTKAQMENSMFAQSAKPSVSMLHGIECDVRQTPVSQLFVRTGAVPSGQDNRWYDLANFQIATNGFQGSNVVIGELWVTYIVEFYKPQIPATFGGYTDSLHVRRSGVATTSIGFGSVGVFNIGSMTASLTSTTITLSTAHVGNKYQFIALWKVQNAMSASPTVAITSGANAFDSLAGSYTISTLTSSADFYSSGGYSAVCTESFEATDNDVVLTVTPGTTTSGGFAVDILVLLMDSTIVQ